MQIESKDAIKQLCAIKLPHRKTPPLMILQPSRKHNKCPCSKTCDPIDLAESWV